MSALVAAAPACLRWLALACVLSVCAVSLSPAPADAARSDKTRTAKRAAKAKRPAKKVRRTQVPPAAGTVRFGVNAGRIDGLSDDQTLALLRSMAAGGLTEVRRDFSWGALQRTPASTPDFGPSDRWVALLARAGLRWFPMLGYSAPGTGVIPGDPMSRPANPATYAAFAAAAVARYGRGGSFWAEHPELPALPVTHYEIWNEPNFARFWREQVTAPEDYAELYAAARTAVKARDAQAVVVTGGLVEMGARSFLTRMYRKRPDLRGKVDAVGFHPYAATADAMLETIAEVRSTLDQLDPGVPIELSEAGFDTLRTPEPRRVQEIGRLVQALRSKKLGVSALHYFSAITEEDAPGQWNAWLGIWNRDGSPKPSATAYMSAAR